MNELRLGFVVWVLLFGLTFAASGQIGQSENSVLYSTSEGMLTTDSSGLFSIAHIQIEGNKRTKPSIILRELAFSEQEQYPLSVLVEKFAETRKQLMNTGLFHEVVVALKSLQGYEASVLISVKERWYIFPIPFIRMVDKDFYQWKREGMSLKRVNYGIAITHNNTTGRNDRLQVNFMNGYTQQMAVSYQGLYLDPKLQWSTNLGFSFGKNREVRYQTVENRQVALKNQNDYIHSYFRSFFEPNYRRAITTRHTIGIAYNYEDMADTIFVLNPRFSHQTKVVRFPEVFYRLSYFNVDFIPYPTSGYAGELSVSKRGLNQEVNLWQLKAKGSATWPLSPKAFFNLRAGGMIKLPFRQPYIMKAFLGYERDFNMQGFEKYVIEGVAGGYTKAVFAHQLFNRTYHIPSQRFKRLNNIPVRVYGKVYGNAGYVYDPQPVGNSLSNRPLFSGGFGLDFVTFYDFIFKLEWSFNAFHQNNLYLHRKNYF